LKMSVRSTVAAALATLALAGNLHDRSFYEAKFFNWLSEQQMKPTSGEHFVHMLQNFANNDDIIAVHNSGNSTYTLGHNKFSHLSLDEWRQEVRLGLTKPELVADFVLEPPTDTSSLATELDWVAKGSVTPVKDQGQCGSCWSFSATGALEGAHHIKTGSLLSLSEQLFVDCDNRKNGGTDLGCNGGLMDSAFAWAKKNGGVCLESEYKYVSGTTKTSGTCDQSVCRSGKFATPQSYTDVTKNSDSAFIAALNKQPVSVAIEADQSAFQLYKSGVFTGTCGSNLDHGVLAVGYGTLSGTDYYKVKNSWGPSWGQGGYILIQRNKPNTPAGQCGILSGPPSYPNV